MSYTAASLVFIAPGIGSLPGLLLTAAADRWSRRAIAATGAGTFALAFALFAWAPNAATLVFAAALAGFGATGMVDAVEVGLVDATTSDRLRVWLARQNVVAVIGGMCGPALLAALAFAGLGWRMAFVLAAAVLGSYAVLLAVSPLPPPRAGDDDDDADEGSGALSDIIRDPRVWVIGLLSLGTVPFDEPFLGFLIAHLGQTRGASAATAIVIALVGVCGGLVTQGTAARRPLRMSNQPLYVVGAAGLLTGSVVVAMAASLPAIAAAAFAVSAGLELCWLAVQHRALTLRPRQVGKTKAVISTIESMGFGLPLAIGAVADAATLTVAMAVFGLLAALLLAVAATAKRALE
jgi:MFS family permease